MKKGVDRTEQFKNKGRASKALKQRREVQRIKASSARRGKRDKALNYKRFIGGDEEDREAFLNTSHSSPEDICKLIDTHIKSVGDEANEHTIKALLNVLQLDDDVCIPHFLTYEHALSMLVAYLGDSGLNALHPQLCWLLGHIAARGIEERNAILSITNNGIDILHLVLSKDATKELMLHGWYAISHLLRGEGAPIEQALENDIVNAAVTAIGTADTDIVAQVCWCLTYITANHPETITEGMNAEVQKILVSILSKYNKEEAGEMGLAQAPDDVFVPLLRCLGNAAVNNQLAVLNDEFLSFVHLLLDHPSRLIALESAWLFSVLTGLDGCADAVLSLNVFPTLNRMLFASTELQVEAAHAIVSLISAGEKALRQSLEHDIPAGMGQLFRYNNSELTVCGLSYIDAVCNAVPNAAMEVIPEQALDTIESLQYADNEEISALAKHITDKHFNFDDEEEYEM
eukprot:m.75012 g.75012  ORF g.75012 m.75012 type:complete len:459 (-) comp11830_c0_seq1:26-1402(-)